MWPTLNVRPATQGNSIGTHIVLYHVMMLNDITNGVLCPYEEVPQTAKLINNLMKDKGTPCPPACGIKGRTWRWFIAFLAAC